jgi:hypothetical protein
MSTNDKVERKDQDSAAQTTREAAKWLVAAFGALGAVLIGNASIQDLGGLSDSGQRQAYVFLGIALLGVLLIIVPAGFVLSPMESSASHLAASGGRLAKYRKDWLKRYHEPQLGGRSSLRQLMDEHELYVHARLVAFSRKHNLTEPERPSGVSSEALQRLQSDGNQTLSLDEQIERTEAALSSTNPYVDQIGVALAGRSLRERFAFTMAALVAGVLLAAVGASGFATAETEEQAKSAASTASPVVDLATAPVAARLVFEDEAKDRFGPLLGDGCDLENVAVLVLSANEETVEVVSLPQLGCDLQRLEVADGQAELNSGESVQCTFGKEAFGNCTS